MWLTFTGIGQIGNTVLELFWGILFMNSRDQGDTITIKTQPICESCILSQNLSTISDIQIPKSKPANQPTPDVPLILIGGISSNFCLSGITFTIGGFYLSF